jgi:GT2 family glycosyltransferase
MIDDDECPQPQWISELLRVADETGADSVIGPVPTALPLDAPKWLRAGRFYDLPTYRDCAAIKFGYSGNCLLRMSSIKRLGMSFDLELNFAGGEDMLFFRQLVERGGKLRYAAHATAYERLEPERLTAPYILRLYFRRGNTLTLCDRRLNHRVMALAARALKGGARVFVGLGMLVPMVCVRGRAGALRALCDIVHGLGSLSGLAGHIYQGYRRVDAPRK